MKRKRGKRPMTAKPGTNKYRWHEGERQVRIVIRDPAAREYAEFRKRTHRIDPMAPGKDDGSLTGRGCEKGRKAIKPMTVQCRRAGCGALIDWCVMKNAVYTACEKTGRWAVAAGAGCANPRHDARRGKDRGKERRHRPQKRFAEAQKGMAAQLVSEERALVAWPAAPDDVNIFQRPDAAVKGAVKIAMARTE